jgi:hypothetical protein
VILSQPKLRAAVAAGEIKFDPPPPTIPHVMNQEQHDAMDRAYWRSVEVLDDGSEG